MVIFLYGPDAYRLKQAKEDIVIRYKTKFRSGINFFFIDFSEPESQSTFENAVKLSSFFNEHKLIICKNIFAKKILSEHVLRTLKNQDLTNASDITLVIAEDYSEKELSTKNKELFNILIGAKNMVKKFEPLSGAKLIEWLNKEVVLRGCHIEPKATTDLLTLTGSESWRIINELDKLSNYTNRITPTDIKYLINSRTDMNIFDLIDALARKDRNRAMELLYQELGTGRDPYYVLTMIIYQFRNIITVKSLINLDYSEPEIVRKSKLNPFVVKKTLKSPFKIEEAIGVYRKLLELDTGFKSGQLNLEDHLYKMTLTPH